MLTLHDAEQLDAEGMEVLHLLHSAPAAEKELLVDGMLSLWNAHRAPGVLPLPEAETVMREELQRPEVGFFYFQAGSQIVAAAAYYRNPDYLHSGCAVVWLQACCRPLPDLEGQTSPSPSPTLSPAPDQEIVTMPDQEIVITPALLLRGLGTRLFEAVQQVDDAWPNPSPSPDPQP